MAIADKLNELVTQRNNLATNLNTMGVTASTDEKLSSLVPKVLDIKSGGSEVTKGLVIKAYDSNGYVTDAELVGMTTIPDYYFYNEITASYGFFVNLVNLKLPTNLTKINQYCFANCRNLALTELPNNITSINSSGFRNCTNLALTKLPTNLTKINDYSFYQCTNLALTELPNNITSISSYAFYYCTNLALTKLPDNITSISSYAFYKCENMALTSLSSKLKTLSSNAFQQCSKLAITEIPSGVTSLSSGCFFSCSGLTEITCKGAVTSIQMQCFQNCTSLKKLVLPNITKLPSLGNSSAFTNTPIASGEGYIYLKDEYVESAKTATNWSTYASQIKGISELPTE